jgi:hypothetical protein
VTRRFFDVTTISVAIRTGHDLGATIHIRICTDSRGVEIVDMKLEVVVLPVSDVDRAKAFYEGLDFRLDADFVADDGLRVVQLTPPGSEGRVTGPDPERSSYGSFASFHDPDGNGWLLQEVKVRAPGR